MRIWKKIAPWAMAFAYVAAGINHLIHSTVYLAIMPSWLPRPSLLVALSGGCEIIFGLLLIPPATRRLGAWLLIASLVAVYPANIQMSVNYWRTNDPHFWITIVRLPLQFVLIWLAWLYTVPRKENAQSKPRSL